MTPVVCLTLAFYIKLKKISVDAAKEEKLHNVMEEDQDQEGELQDKARDIPDIKKKSDKEVRLDVKASFTLQNFPAKTSL